jgi:hypothetical protein
MRSKRVSITHTNINTKLNQEIDMTMVIQHLNQDPKTCLPKEIQIVNECGAGVEFLFLTDVEEYNEYLAEVAAAPDPEDVQFNFVRLPKDEILSDDSTSLPRAYKMIVRGYETTATKSLLIEFINYR